MTPSSTKMAGRKANIFHRISNPSYSREAGLGGGGVTAWRSCIRPDMACGRQVLIQGRGKIEVEETEEMFEAGLDPVLTPERWWPSRGAAMGVMVSKGTQS